MGGKFGYFGLWIDGEFGTGKGAPTCTTFTSPQLSTEEDFLIHNLEVWGLGPEPEKEEVRTDNQFISRISCQNYYKLQCMNFL